MPRSTISNKKAKISVPTAPLIRLERCSVIFGKHRALDDVSFALREGERWVLIGPNGSGKTVLLKLLRGDLWPTPLPKVQERRKYCFDGELSSQPIGVKERIAYIGPERQDRYVRYDWNHSVAQVVTTGLFDEDIPRTAPTKSQCHRVASLLRQFGLWSLRRRGFLTLSYGQRRRTLVARAFAGSPQILLFDEVFNGLDRSSAAILRRALSRVRGVGATWIVTTHRSQDVPSNATHEARIENGKIISTSAIKFRRLVHAPQKLKRIQVPRDIASPEPSKEEKGVSLIQLRNVDLYRNYRLVLRGVDWTIERGEHWAIVGRNGSGKSTLLKLLYGDLHPKLGGSIDRDGVPFGTPISEWKRRVGFVSPELQADYFLAKNIEEVVISGRYASIGLNDSPTPADRRDARRWLKYFQIDHLADRKPRAVSYGQMRLALLARAMINDPELLLLDEPCTGLDPDMRMMVVAMLERLVKGRVQLVMAVHEQSDLPACVTRLLRIRNNRTVQLGNLSEKDRDA